MLSFPKGKFRNEIWFSTKPPVRDIVSFNIFRQCFSTQKLWGFKREDFFTKIIDLTQSETEIQNQFNKTTKYDMNRAGREKVQFRLGESIDSFISFYNEFAETKGLQFITSNLYFQDRENFKITMATLDGNTLVMHCYLTDVAIKRVRLLYSASHFRIMDNVDKSMVGRANKFLHYQDMLYFKDQGYAYYDLGGYGKDSIDDEILKINTFKDGFGGSLVRQSNYIPYLYILFQKLKPF
jgi:hypothetical protein